MTSPAKLAANRRNALQSTGPLSPEGKAVSSKNALRHGLLSREALLPQEKDEDLQAFRARLWEAVHPEGELEELLLDRLASTAWRLRRVLAVEVGLFSSYKDGGRPRALLESYRLASMEDKTGHFQTLSRYEAGLERSFYRALHELRTLQSLRAGGSFSVAAGAVVYLPDNGRNPKDEG